MHVRLLKPVKPSELRGAIQTALGLEQPAVAGPKRESERPQRSLRILLAEDGWANQKLAAGLLKKWGHEVFIANNGQDAVDQIEAGEYKFDLILMDVQMPVMDGLEATRQIRRLEAERGQHLPIVAMTAHVKIGDEERCLEAGMDGYLSKPIRREQLLDAIQEIVLDAEHPDPDPDPEDIESPVDGFDLASALDAVEGDEELLRDVIQVFLEECPQLVQALTTAVQTQDVTTMKRCAHTVKGATRIFGNPRVTALSKTLEERAGEARFDDADTLLSELSEATHQLSVGLQNYLDD